MTESEKTPIADKKAGMSAVIVAGGHQYVVSAGLKIRIEHERGSTEAGSEIIFDNVLTVFGGDLAEAKVGTPTVAGAKVTGKVLGEKKMKKIIIFKKKRRNGYTKKQGHRQQVTEVQIEQIHV